ncbi:MAG: cation diffusion facilitator family transporter [Erysipelotrichaceae bacterium]|jgi:cation diffusion facilitator family transporter
MTDFLLKTFVKNYQKTENSEVRKHVGFLSSIVGLICNIFLFLAKYIMGTISNSIAIISDGFNNLSDCLSNIITLVSYKLAAQPADKDHPFGHGRIEYLSSLIIAVIIMLVGFSFLKNSFIKILHPEKVNFNIITVISLAISIVVKIWMGIFNKKLGEKYNSSIMLATSKDSINDSYITLVTLSSLFISLFTTLPVDGVIGCLVSILILKAGYEIIKDTVDTLIGAKADEETVQAITDLVLSHDDVIGIHDLIVHNYGPGRLICSLHAEVDSKRDMLEVHDTIDLIERQLYEKLNIMASIHMDPVEVDNPLVIKYKQLVTDIIEEIDPELSFHDFRIVTGPTHTNLIFDLVVTHDYIGSTKELKNKIESKIKEKDDSLYTVISIDTQF